MKTTFFLKRLSFLETMCSRL